MKKKFFPLLSLLLCLVLFTSVCPPPADAVSNAVYLLAVNDKFCDFSDGERPVSVNGVIYIPYKVFDKAASGTDIGVYYGIVKDDQTILTLYSLSSTLRFYVGDGTCTDGPGNPMDFHAVVRYGIPYVPAAAVCSHFSLNYSYLPTADRGTLIRVSDARAALPDNVFLNSASVGMLTRYNDILRAENAAAVPEDTASPPSGEEKVPETPKEKIPCLLALDVATYEGNVADLIDGQTPILFLFPAENLVSWDSQIRLAAAMGAPIGLLFPPEAEDPPALLRRCDELLAHMARIRCHIAAGESARGFSAEEDGIILWETDIKATSSAERTAERIEKRARKTRLLLPNTSSGVTRLVRTLKQGPFRLLPPTETALL